MNELLARILFLSGSFLTKAEESSITDLKRDELNRQKQISDLKSACDEYKKYLQEMITIELSKDKLVSFYYKNSSVEEIIEEREDRKDLLGENDILFENAQLNKLLQKYTAMIDLCYTLCRELKNTEQSYQHSKHKLEEFTAKYSRYIKLFQPDDQSSLKKASQFFWKSKESQSMEVFKLFMQQNKYDELSDEIIATSLRQSMK